MLVKSIKTLKAFAEIIIKNKNKKTNVIVDGSDWLYKIIIILTVVIDALKTQWI